MARTLVEHFQDMAANNAWSNRRLLAACLHLTDAEFAAARTSFFPSLQQTLNHIFIVDRYYLADLTGEGRSIVADEIPYPAAADLAAAQAAQDQRLIAFCRGLNDASLQKIIPINRKDGVDYRETMGAILAHLFLHQIHHRGQAHAMLAGTKVAPPQLDEFFLAHGAPESLAAQSRFLP